jgi:L-malate glycosyltransferase
MSWRGGQNQLHLLLQEQIKQGIDCRLAVRPGSALALRSAGLCPRLLLKMRNEADLPAALKIDGYCRREKIDLIHAHDARSHGLSLWSKALNPGLKTIVHRRVEFPPGGNIYNRFKYSSRSITSCIAVSDRVRQVMLGFLPPEKLFIVGDASFIPESLGPDRKSSLRSELCRSLGAGEGLPLILAAGHLSPEKGHRSLIQALDLLKQKGQEITAVIAGEGPSREDLEVLVRDLDLQDRVFLPGFRDDIRELLQIGDVFVMPSLSEGLGSGILEAMACGCPVAASRAGGIPEIVQDEETGLLFEPGQPSQMAEMIRRLLNDRPGAGRMGLNGQRYVRDNFDPSSLALKVTSIYHQAMEKR